MTPKRCHRRNCNEPGHAHGVTFSCYLRFRFLQAERTCRWLAEAIGEARADLNFSLWAYVFMPEHVHLIVWLRDPVYDIADIRKAIKSSVGRTKRSAAPADASRHSQVAGAASLRSWVRPTGLVVCGLVFEDGRRANCSRSDSAGVGTGRCVMGNAGGSLRLTSATHVLAVALVS
jgi:REP element-mobilizing transposase RayT